MKTVNTEVQDPLTMTAQILFVIALKISTEVHHCVRSLQAAADASSDNSQACPSEQSVPAPSALVQRSSNLNASCATVH